MGPLGGAKLVASAVSKGAKATKVVVGAGAKVFQYTKSKGGKALEAAMKRLGEIPIFLPVGVGTGAFVKMGQIIRPISAWTHRKALRNAVEALHGVARGAGETTHHIVALNDPRAKEARKLLAKFGIDIDDGVNGVFLPASTKSPNPKGAMVHSKLHTNAYYFKVESYLGKAKSKQDLINRLQRIRETLLDGSFHNAIK
jgi:hypothetical protein